MEPTRNYTVTLSYTFDVECIGDDTEQKNAARIAMSDYCRTNPAAVALDCEVKETESA